MECTTTNSRQNNERLKNRLSFKLLIAVFIEIQYFSANVSLPLCLSLFLQWTHSYTHTCLVHAMCKSAANMHTHTNSNTYTHTHWGSYFFLRVEYVFGSIISLWYWAISHMLKGMCWRCGESVGNTHTHPANTRTHKYSYSHWLWLGWMVWVLRQWCNSLEYSVRAEPSHGDYWYGWHRQGCPGAPAGFSFS